MYLKIEAIGRLGKDPESRYTPSGQMVTAFSVATDRKYKNSAGESVKETIWLRVETWGNLANSCKEYLHKGSLIFLEGHLKADKSTGGPRVWTKQDGSASASYDITAATVRFLSSREEHAPANTGAEIGEMPPEDDIPF